MTSTAFVDACLARIAARDGEVHAFARLAPDARAKAEEADAASHRPPLHGVPVAVKDIIDTADMPTEYGSPIFAGHAAERRCQLRRAAAARRARSWSARR